MKPNFSNETLKYGLLTCGWTECDKYKPFGYNQD